MTPPPSAWSTWAGEEAGRLHAAGRWRTVRDLTGSQPETVLRGPGGDRPVVSFAGNDYLGLARHPAVVDAARDALARWGVGAGAARLLAGARPVHRQLEAALADWKQAEAAVLFPTGYAANLGVLGALAGPDVRILSDERNHASIVDGCRLARSALHVYPHGDLGAVERALRGGASRTLVVSESVFSMDGDRVPVEDLAELCARHDALLVLDEAHAVLDTDVTGRSTRAPVLRVGTLSKALGSLGGFVAGPSWLCQLIVNRARSFVFTTAPPPAFAAAALAALAVVRSAEGDALRARLRANVERLIAGHPSPIVPVIVGQEAAAVAASNALLDKGFFVPAIRPPTVAPGTSRLRVSVSAAHTGAHLDALAAALAALAIAA